MILLTGGKYDVNIEAIAAILTQRGHKFTTLFTDDGCRASLHWDLHSDVLTLNHAPIKPSALYIRFNHNDLNTAKNQDGYHRTHAWYHTLLDWGSTHKEARMLNRAYSTRG